MERDATRLISEPLLAFQHHPGHRTTSEQLKPGQVTMASQAGRDSVKWAAQDLTEAGAQWLALLTQAHLDDLTPQPATGNVLVSSGLWDAARQRRATILFGGRIPTHWDLYRGDITAEGHLVLVVNEADQRRTCVLLSMHHLTEDHQWALARGYH
ncbi:hypothetical protein NDU88_003637 [Pleurodeles waltl]|uniref:Uncharacterized protein n=1 Tax=Pleurodeles waltl TaxID=8319 RepID=A0AAV7L2C9_PLEWA|nr:hypothetical protein NDU88_003637 [Pleurodeles waltl]